MSEEITNQISYEPARNYFSDIGRNSEQISSVIEFGTRQASGLSDIDVMVIVETDALFDSRPIWADYDSYPQNVKDSLDGGAIKIVTESQFIRLPILGAMNVHYIFGRSIHQQEPDDQTRQLINLVDVMDWLAERIVTLSAHIRSNAAHATRAINCAYSITHTFQRAYDAGAISSEISTIYRQKVDKFRQAWRKSPKNMSGQLISWLSQCLDDAYKLSTIVATYVESEMLYLPLATSDQNKFRFNNGILLFESPLKDKSEEFGSSVPSVWLTHLVAQSQRHGTIPSSISSRLFGVSKNTKIEVSSDISNLLSIRMQLCNEMVDTLLPLGMRNNIYRFGHLLSP